MRSVSGELTNFATSALSSPDLFVHLHEAGARNQALGDLVRQRLGLQEGMMRKDPDVPHLMSHRPQQLVIVEGQEETSLHR